VVRVDQDEEMSPEDKEEKKTNEIIEMYQTKNGDPVIKHKSFFDELWEKQHPNEAKKMMKEEKDMKIKKEREAKAALAAQKAKAKAEKEEKEQMAIQLAESKKAKNTSKPSLSYNVTSP
jgi:hypothetical protein